MDFMYNLDRGLRDFIYDLDKGLRDFINDLDKHWVDVIYYLTMTGWTSANRVDFMMSS